MVFINGILLFGLGNSVQKTYLHHRFGFEFERYRAADEWDSLALPLISRARIQLALLVCSKEMHNRSNHSKRNSFVATGVDRQ